MNRVYHIERRVLESIHELVQAAGTVVFQFFLQKEDTVLDSENFKNQMDQLFVERDAFLGTLETRVFSCEDEDMYYFLIFIIEKSELLQNKDQSLFFGKTFYEAFDFYNCEIFYYDQTMPAPLDDNFFPEMDGNDFALALVPFFDEKKVTYFSLP
jgi:hypothetical protein